MATQELTRREKVFIGTHANVLLREALECLGQEVVKTLDIPKRVRWAYDADTGTNGYTNYTAEHYGNNVVVHVHVIVDPDNLSDTIGFGIVIYNTEDEVMFSCVEDPR